MIARLKHHGKQLYLALTGGVQRSAFSIHGVQVEIPSQIDTRIRFFIARGRYENAEAALVRAHVAPGDTVIELGGALGVISAVIRDQIGPEGQHIVVEPNEAVFEVCARNARSGDTLGRTQMVAAAIAYGTPKVTLVREASLLDNHVAAGRSDGQDSKDVPATSLADLHKTIGGERFVLVCDIEGAEVDLVENDALALAHCDKIIMEVHPAFMESRGKSLQMVLDGLSAMGFEQVSLERNALFMSRNVSRVGAQP